MIYINGGCFFLQATAMITGGKETDEKDMEFNHQMLSHSHSGSIYYSSW